MTTQIETKNEAVEATGQAAEALAAAEIVTVPLGKLVASPFNVRKKSLGDIRGMADNIRVVGLLQNLVVHEIVTGKGKAKVVDFGVAAGQRRKAALSLLLQDGSIDATYPVPVKVVSEEAAILISISENTQRENMHPADQVNAFGALEKAGRSHEFIASVFGVPVAQVKRMLHLFGMSAALLQLFADDAISYEQLKALSAAPDHETQERTWSSAVQRGSWATAVHELKRAITSQHYSETSNLAKFAGIDAYLAAGGRIARDMFAEDGDGFLVDDELLNTLVNDKLQEEARRIESEGWKWALAQPRFDYSEENRYFRLPAKMRDLTADEAKEKQEIEGRFSEIETRLAELEEAGDEGDEFATLEAEYDSLEARMHQLDNRPREFSDEQKAIGGAMVSIDRYGQLQVVLGCIKPEDRGAVVASGNKMLDRYDVPVSQQRVQAAIAADKKPIHSEKLKQRLQAHRSVGIAAELAAKPTLALVVLTHDMAVQHFERGMGRSLHSLGVTLTSARHSLNQAADDLPQNAAWQALQQQEEMWLQEIPNDFAKSYTWLHEWETDKVLRLFAYLVSTSVNNIESAQYTGVDREFGVLAEVTSLDMKLYWKPSAALYFSHVSKARICEVVGAAKGAESALPLASLKKSEAADAAEKVMMDSNWLPDELRSPSHDDKR